MNALHPCPARASATRRRHPAQAGFGLVEMMVALVLGLIVVGGALVLFLSTRQANASTDNLARMQDAVRTSHDLMAREVREAGGTPCDAQVVVANVLNNAQGATPTWWATWAEPLRGYAAGVDFPGAATGTGTGQRVAGTAALVVRYATPYERVAVTAHNTATTTLTTSLAAHGIATGDVVMACNYRQASIFQVTDVDLAAGTLQHAASATGPGNCSAGLGLPTVCTAAGTTYQYTTGSQIGRFVAAGWFLGFNGRPQTGGRSLYRVSRNGTEEVAEGVSDLQLSYLVDGGTDYVGAATVTDWSRVLAVRVDLRFEGADSGVSTRGTSQRLLRDVGFTLNLRNLQP